MDTEILRRVRGVYGNQTCKNKNRLILRKRFDFLSRKQRTILENNQLDTNYIFLTTFALRFSSNVPFDFLIDTDVVSQTYVSDYVLARRALTVPRYFSRLSFSTRTRFGQVTNYRQ